MDAASLWVLRSLLVFQAIVLVAMALCTRELGPEPVRIVLARYLSALSAIIALGVMAFLPRDLARLLK